MTYAMFIDLLIKISLLFGAVCLLDFFWKNASAAVRHRLWTCACLFALLLPMPSLVLPQYPLAILPNQTAKWEDGVSVLLEMETSRFDLGSEYSALKISEASPPDFPNPIDDRLLAEETSTAIEDLDFRVASTAATPKSDQSDLHAKTDVLPRVKSKAETKTARLPNGLILIWIVGVFVALTPWLLGQRLIRGLTRDFVVTDNELQQEMALMCRKLGIRWAVQIRESSTTTAPMTWGIFSPVIMLPATWRQWPLGAWQAALSHELVHIQRRDLVCQLLARVTCAIYWFHPLTWYAAWKMKVEREMACDDHIISLSQTASDYAQHLVAIAKSCVGPVPYPAISMAQASGLERRARTMFDSVRSHGPLSRGTSTAIFALALLCAVPLMAVHASLVQISNVSPEPTKPDITDWLSIDTAVVVHVSELTELIDIIVELEPLGDAALRRIQELLTDPKFPVFNAKELPDVLAKAESCYNLLRQAERASLVIHSAKDGKLDWSLFIETDPDQQADLLAAMRELTAAIEQAVASTPEVDHDPEDRLFDYLKKDKKIEFDQIWCQVESLDSWVVVFNSLENFQQIQNRWENSDHSRSLGQSRKYARAMNQLTSTQRDDQVAMQIYVNPVEVVEWIPYGDAEEWERLKIHEIVSVGASLFFSPAANESDPNMPLILLDASVYYTQPAVGYAKMFQSYRPVKLPPLAVEPIELLAYARDEETFFRDKISSIDQATQPGATEQEWLQQLEGLDADWIWEMMDRRKSITNVVYRTSENEIDEVIVIEEVDDLSSAQRYAEKTVARAESFAKGEVRSNSGASFLMRSAETTADQADSVNKEVLQTTEGPSYRRWQLKSEFADIQGIAGHAKNRDLPAAAINPFFHTYALTDRWWITGNRYGANKQIELILSSDDLTDQPITIENKTEKIDLRVEAMYDRISSNTLPVMIQYLTQYYWANQLRAQEWQYSTSEMQVIYTATEAEKFSTENEEILKIREERDEILGNPQPTVMRFEMETNADGETKQVMKVFNPKPRNPTADEFGFWLRPCSRQDQLKLAQLTLLKAMSQRMGEQIILWDRNDSSIRIALGIFPSSAYDSDDKKQPNSLNDD